MNNKGTKTKGTKTKVTNNKVGGTHGLSRRHTLVSRPTYVSRLRRRNAIPPTPRTPRRSRRLRRTERVGPIQESQVLE